MPSKRQAPAAAAWLATAPSPAHQTAREQALVVGLVEAGVTEDPGPHPTEHPPRKRA